MAFWRFNATGAVELYEAIVPTLQLWATVSNGIDLSNVAVQTAAINVQICPAIQSGCTGANQVYDSDAVSEVRTPALVGVSLTL